MVRQGDVIRSESCSSTLRTPSIIWQFTWAWIYAPYLLWKIRRIGDVHNWRLQTIICSLAGYEEALWKFVGEGLQVTAYQELLCGWLRSTRLLSTTPSIGAALLQYGESTWQYQPLLYPADIFKVHSGDCRHGSLPGFHAILADRQKQKAEDRNTRHYCRMGTETTSLQLH